MFSAIRQTWFACCLLLKYNIVFRGFLTHGEKWLKNNPYCLGILKEQNYLKLCANEKRVNNRVLENGYWKYMDRCNFVICTVVEDWNLIKNIRQIFEHICEYIILTAGYCRTRGTNFKDRSVIQIQVTLTPKTWGPKFIFDATGQPFKLFYFSKHLNTQF